MKRQGWSTFAVGSVCAAAITFGLGGLQTSAQSSDPSLLPLVTQSGISYLGGFRVPGGTNNGVDFAGGGIPIAFNAANNSLFAGTWYFMSELSIPTPVNSADVNELPFASFLQGFADPTEGRLRDVSGSVVELGGILPYRGRLVGNAYIYYDANNTQRVSHYARSLSLAQPSVSSWSQVWDADRQGFVAGYMSLVPPEWQASLGGPAIAGQCCLSIIWRTSYGPSAFVFDPAQVGQPAVAAAPLLYYPSNQTTLGAWEDSNPTYGAGTRVKGVAIIAGTRTALFFGRNGIGPFCYGDGSPLNPPPPGQCYDPVYSSKAQHTYPYRYQAWAYDLNDFAAVKAGTKQPWEVVPYGVWELTFPIDNAAKDIGGVAYDAERQLLYVSQLYGDGTRPLIHAFKVNATPGAIVPAGNTVSTVSLWADKTTPQSVATPITFTAQAGGGVAPYQYKWLITDGSTTTVAANWTASRQYVWTPSAANANYRVVVWVRSAGNTADAMEASTSIPFAISASGRTDSVSVTANRVAPQPPLSAITWTAAPLGGAAPHQYKWLVSDGATTTVAANWSTLSSFTWTPSIANANYLVTGWVRSAGSTADAPEASASAHFPIEGGSVPPGGASVSSVTLTANTPAPQPSGAPITWSAVPTGGSAPYLYKWSIFDGATWTVAANWGSAASYNWVPTAANANYRVRVGVKAASSHLDQPEAAAEQGFAITAPLSATTPAPVVTAPPGVTTPAPVTPVSSVTLTPDKSSPQPAGTTVVFTAQAVNGVSPYQYQWWVLDDDKWTAATGWMSDNTFRWLRNSSSPKYQIQVRARSASSLNTQGEATAIVHFVINNGKGKD